MAGVLDFDVSALEIREIVGTQNPATIVKVTDSFELGATFNGSGFVWDNLKLQAQEYRVSYFAEGIGMAASEVDLGSGPALPVRTLTAADTYGFADTKITVLANTLGVGVYRIACVVTFPNFAGLVGFFEDLIIQIYQP